MTEFELHLLENIHSQSLVATLLELREEKEETLVNFIVQFTNEI